MKIVVGIDPGSPSESLTNLVGRLGMNDATILCASFAPFPLSDAAGWPVGSQKELAGMLELQRESAQRANERACSELGKFGLRCHSTFESGEPSTRLAAVASDIDADLVAVGSRHRGPLEAFLLGSVGRSLALGCSRSLLIAKGRVDHTGPLKAVFAHDGSPFCDRCVDELIRLSAHGIRSIDVLAVDAKDIAWRAEARMERAEAAACRFRKGSFHADAYLLPGDVNRTIGTVAVDHGADLVIVGSKGHGWLDRTLFGSVTLAQAVTGTRSLLIVHPQEKP